MIRECTPISNGTHQDLLVALVTTASKQKERLITAEMREAIPGPSSLGER